MQTANRRISPLDDCSNEMTAEARVVRTPLNSEPRISAVANRRFDLLVSAHFVQAGRVGGAEQMLYALIKGFCQIGQPVKLLVTRPDQLDAGFRRWFQNEKCGEMIITGNSRRRFVAEQMACLDRDIAGDAVIFPNYFTPPIMPRRVGNPLTVIHDLQYRYFPEYFSRRRRAWLNMAHRLTLRKAFKVIAISSSVRDDIGKHYGDAAAAQTTVIHDPIDWTRFEGKGENGPMPSGTPYILSVAAQYPHKNLATLVRAYGEVRKRYPDHKLVLVGQARDRLLGTHGGADLSKIIAEEGLSNSVVITGYLGDRELGHLLRNATLFAFPSVFEGFGMPPLEAMGFGIPTITTRCGSLPEVTLGRAIYVEKPYCVGEWADRISEVLDAPAKHWVAADDVAEIRRRYAPSTIAAQYLQALEIV